MTEILAGRSPALPKAVGRVGESLLGPALVLVPRREAPRVVCDGSAASSPSLES